jgi:hypothetical protein
MCGGPEFFCEAELRLDSYPNAANPTQEALKISFLDN